MSGTYSQAAAADRLDASAADGLVERERERTREKGKEREGNRDREGGGEGEGSQGGWRGGEVRVKVPSSSNLLLWVGGRRGLGGRGVGTGWGGGDRGGGKGGESGDAERGREEG